MFVAGAIVTNNTIVNPVAGISDTSGKYDAPYAEPAAIYLDSVCGSVTVTNNKIQNLNPWLVGQVSSVLWSYEKKKKLLHKSNTSSRQTAAFISTSQENCSHNALWQSQVCINQATPRCCFPFKICSFVQAIMVGSNASAPAAMSICSNAIVNSDGSMQALPNSPWARVYNNNSQVQTSANSLDSTYPAIGDRLNQAFPLSTITQPATISFNFTGTQVQWLSCTGSGYGKATVQLDGTNVSAVDASITRVALQNIDPNVGFCNQILYDSGPLPFQDHSIQILVLNQTGSRSQSGGTAIADLGFAYINGQNQCKGTPAATAAVAVFETESASFAPYPGASAALGSSPSSASSPQSPASAPAPRLFAPAASVSPTSSFDGVPSVPYIRQQFLPASVVGKRWSFTCSPQGHPR